MPCVCSHIQHIVTHANSHHMKCVVAYMGSPDFPWHQHQLGYGYLVDLVCLFLFYFRQRGGGGIIIFNRPIQNISSWHSSRRCHIQLAANNRAKKEKNNNFRLSSDEFSSLLHLVMPPPHNFLVFNKPKSHLLIYYVVFLFCCFFCCRYTRPLSLSCVLFLKK